MPKAPSKAPSLFDLKVLLGTVPSPSWLAIAGLPVFHVTAYFTLDLIFPAVSSAMPGFQDGLAAALPSLNIASPQVFAVLPVVLNGFLTLLTFYAYHLDSCLASDVFDNQHSRLAPSRTKPGLSARLYGAHTNQLETFPLFAISALSSLYLKSTPESLHAVAVYGYTHVAFRLMYWGVYAGNLGTLRSAAFVIGLHCAARVAWEGLKA